MSNNKEIIAFVSYYAFPCSHPVIENVFAKEIAKRHPLRFFLHGKIIQGRSQKWHNSEVFLSRKLGSGKWRTFISNKTFSWRIIFRLALFLKRNKVKIIFVRDMPIFLLALSFFKPIFKFRIYFQYSAPHGDIRLGTYKTLTGFERLFNFLIAHIYNSAARLALSTADIVFPITSFHKDQLVSYIAPERLVPLTMGIDEDWLRGENDLQPDLCRFKKDNYILIYFGSVDPTRNPKFILQVFAQIKDKIKNCKLLIITTTPDWWEKQKLTQICHQLKIQKDTIVKGPLNRKDIRSHLSCSDVSLCPIPPTHYYRISSPTKLYESLGNGIPVIANCEINEQEKVVRESRGGILVNYDTNSFAQATINLLKNERLRKYMAAEGRKYITKNYTYQVIANNILRYFE